MLVDEILSIKPKDVITEINEFRFRFNPFYLEDLDNTKVFQYLIKIEDLHLDQAFNLILNKMNQIILLGEKTSDNQVFSIKEPFDLLDVDFFTIQPKKDQPFSH